MAILYFREISDFMRASPRLDFKMIQLVRAVGGRPASYREWERRRKAIRRVLVELVRLGFVIERPPSAPRGGFKTYRWVETRPGHELVEYRD